MLKSVLFMFCPRSFTVSGFTSLLSKQGLFYLWCKKVAQLYSFTFSVQFFLPFIEDTVFSPLYIFASFVVLIDHTSVSLFLGFLFCPIDLCVCFSGPVTYCFDTYSFVLYLEIWECESSSFVLLSQDCFGYQYLLWFHTNFRIICSNSMKNALAI